jgi:tetratricopeptide (TPR) repeat protein
VLDSGANRGALAGALCDLATTSWLIGDASEMHDLANRALLLARSSENWRAVRQSVYYVGRALVLGPTPCEEAAARMAALVEAFVEHPMVQASARLDLALLLAMLGRWDEADDHASSARVVFRELGQRRWLAAGAITTGLITWWRGDAEGAEDDVREAYDLFTERGEREEAALTGQELAKILFDLGRHDEATELIDEVLSVMATDDLEPQIESRSLRARVLATRGSYAEAERLSMEAEDLVNRTDFVSLHGTVLLTRAHVFELAGRPEQAVAAAESAFELFERKGNRVWARKTQDFLATVPR